MKFNGQSSVEIHADTNLEDLKAVTSISLFMRVDPDQDPIEDRFIFYLGDRNVSTELFWFDDSGCTKGRASRKDSYENYVIMSEIVSYCHLQHLCVYYLQKFENTFQFKSMISCYGTDHITGTVSVSQLNNEGTERSLFAFIVPHLFSFSGKIKTRHVVAAWLTVMPMWWPWW